ncbi:cob(I)yrinic acid a,c-diamide adenosyltransferase [uncultured Subdoligranulum sp.]|uniref:cob(I)yrinic acid a,c-diamide adenosyltransferase n=1 Tax=uncultured Subdoligranulum sp. TaxID=512298 RepID=UPI002624C8ED|nr:cob(I)yrinic acid a,c-diamide adenosyltransferase [uncultured Subdoligranulum sp.]
MVHLYWGNGKGKTTAAMGLALRALGHQRRVAIIQFLKDGSSGEIEPLRRMGAMVYTCPNAKFTWLMNEEERTQAKENANAALRAALEQSWDLLVLDEACAAEENDLVDRELLQQAVACSNAGSEVVLTGRTPADWMQAAADYSTEMRACQHPFTKGVAARVGIEF